MPVSASRRLMSSRTRAELDPEAASARAVLAQQADGDLVEPVLEVVQGQAGAQQDPHAFSRPGWGVPTRSAAGCRCGW